MSKQFKGRELTFAHIQRLIKNHDSVKAKNLGIEAWGVVKAKNLGIKSWGVIDYAKRIGRAINVDYGD